MKRTTITGVAVLTLGAAASLQAASFSYSDSDLLLAFRQSGRPDLVIDIGKVTKYKTQTPGSTLTITNAPTGLSNLLSYAYPSLDSLSWSVEGAAQFGGTFPLQTIWLSSPRADSTQQTSPWNRAGQFTQGDAASQIAAIGVNAASYSSAHPSTVTNTVSGLLIPSTDQNAYTPLIQDPYNSSVSDLAGSWGQGNIENVTPFDFDSDEPLSVSDLYELQPNRSGGPGTFLGYFSFTPDGTVTFTAASVSATPPTIKSVARSGNVSTISFTTQAGFTYSLLETNHSGLFSPKSSWPLTGASIAGTGAILYLTDTNSSSEAFYAIRAQ